MKKLITILLATVTFCGLQAQDKSSATTKANVKKIYFQAGAGTASRTGSNGGINLQAIINNKWSATLSYHNISMKPKNQPADYVPESGFILFLPYSNEIKVNMQLFSFTTGKYFPLGHNSWFTTEAGVSIVNGEKVNFQPATNTDPGGFFFIAAIYPSNYSTSIEKKTTFGGMLRADFTYAFCSFMGLGAGIFANFNSIQSPVGYQVKLVVGAMGRHSETKKRK